MDYVNRNFLFVLVLVLISSCAKLEYLYEQGIGQVKIFSTARDNSEVVKNVRIPKTQREKVLKIERLKKYFYQYWQKKETRIYTQTTMLKNKAVSYLVITSPFDEIKAVETCFPIMGCFPYLGFFNHKSALNHAKAESLENKVTWIRPVYAYSTLGYFNDTILSSFFNYNDYELTDLIFHELFHTIFFVKNEVELNENLANYFAKVMVKEYFINQGLTEYLHLQEKEEKEHRELSRLIMIKASELQNLYQNIKPKTPKEAAEILNEFSREQFIPEVLKKCEQLTISHQRCFPLGKEWNNARFAAFLTYEKRANDIEKLQKKLNLNLKEYYQYLVKKYAEYEKIDDKEGFSKYLFKDLI